MATEKHYLDKDGLSYLKGKMDETYAAKSELESAKQELQTSIEGKAESTHQHVATDVSDGDTHWALTSHTHTAEQLTGVAAEEHTHTAENITDGDEHWALTGHTHTAENITDGNDTWAGKTHNHTASEITDGTTVFAEHEHTHSYADITDLDERLEGLGTGSSKPINDATVTLSPSTYVYDAAEHKPSVQSVMLGDAALTVNQDYMAWIEGQTNAGSYNASVFGIMDYGGGKEVPWTITKAKGSITATPTTVTISGVIGSSVDVTLAVVGDGAISVSANDYIGGVVSADKKKITLTSKKETTAAQTITLTMADGANYTGASCSITATIQVASTTLEQNTWDVIAQISASGKASTMWKVGDEKSITINSKTYHMQIIGFDHDDLDSTDAKYNDATYNGGKKKAGITFLMKEIYDTYYPMHTSNSNSCSWRDSAMRKTTIPALLKLFDTSAQNVMRTVIKKTATSYSSSTIISTSDKLFLPSEIEVFNTTSYSHSGEGTQYAYYKAGNSKIKNKGGSADYWWLRSPSTNNGYFVGVDKDGNYYAWYATDSTTGVAAGFCV